MNTKNKVLKYLNYKTYNFNNGHDKDFAIFDSKVISIICFCFFLMMFGILIFVLANPEVRYDSGLDNLPKLILYSVVSAIGVVIARWKVTSNKAIYAKYTISQMYMSILFLSLSLYSFIATDAKADAIFTYLMYCLIVISMLHINPIFYSIQTIIYLVLTTGLVKEHFNSLGAMFSYIGLMFATVFIAFYNNISTRRKLEKDDELARKEAELKEELHNKQMEAVLKQMSMQDHIIEAIADLVESRDVDTGVHIKATAYYVKILVNGLLEEGIYDIDRHFASLVEKSAPMHDVGKISIPDSILKAPRRLTDEEFEIMKTHTVSGVQIIRHIYDGITSEDYIECAANIAFYHHERWDGKGYPAGLSGENIPLEARIMAVADVFDAITSKRCYKESYPISEAFNELIRCSGTQFDPELVKIFLKHKDEIEQTIVSEFRNFCE